MQGWIRLEDRDGPAGTDRARTACRERRRYGESPAGCRRAADWVDRHSAAQKPAKHSDVSGDDLRIADGRSGSRIPDVGAALSFVLVLPAARINGAHSRIIPAGKGGGADHLAGHE